MSETTIGISRKLRKELIEIKAHPRETYEEVIWRLIDERRT